MDEEDISPGPKRVLVAPLDWGLGHATRCFPLIRALLARNMAVIIAAGGRPYYLLKQEFPELPCVRLEGYNIQYPKSGGMLWSMIRQLPKMAWGIRKEHHTLKQLIQHHQIDAVISDHRYGLWSKKVPSVFMTHQLKIKLPPQNKWLEGLVGRINRWFIHQYDSCWVPDFETRPNLSGSLSHNTRLNGMQYVGPLSRFEKREVHRKFDLIAVLSGPEPQRTIFERILIEQLQATPYKALIVQGITEKASSMQLTDKLELVSHLNAIALNEAIQASDLVIARSGYSTIMDLAVLGKNAILVPTPGQTEQEYLADKLRSEQICFSMLQEDFDLEKAIRAAKPFKGFSELQPHRLLDQAIDTLVQRL